MARPRLANQKEEVHRAIPFLCEAVHTISAAITGAGAHLLPHRVMEERWACEPGWVY